MILITTSWINTTSILKELRAFNNIDYYLSSDEIRRRNHDISTMTTLLKRGRYSEELRAFNNTGFYFYRHL